MYKTEYRELRDEEWLREHYLNKYMTMKQMCELVGCAYPA